MWLRLTKSCSHHLSKGNCLFQVKALLQKPAKILVVHQSVFVFLLRCMSLSGIISQFWEETVEKQSKFSSSDAVGGILLSTTDWKCLFVAVATRWYHPQVFNSLFNLTCGAVCGSFLYTWYSNSVQKPTM